MFGTSVSEFKNFCTNDHDPSDLLVQTKTQMLELKMENSTLMRELQNFKKEYKKLQESFYLLKSHAQSNTKLDFELQKLMNANERMESRLKNFNQTIENSKEKSVSG